MTLSMETPFTIAIWSRVLWTMNHVSLYHKKIICQICFEYVGFSILYTALTGLTGLHRTCGRRRGRVLTEDGPWRGRWEAHQRPPLLCPRLMGWACLAHLRLQNRSRPWNPVNERMNKQKTERSSKKKNERTNKNDRTNKWYKNEKCKSERK